MKRTAVALLFTLLQTSLYAENRWIDFVFTVEDYPTDRIVESLVAGHRSEVRYEIRLLKRVTGLRRILGDVLIHREEISYVARWDAMDELFVVQIDGTQERTFAEKEPFIAFFLSLTDHRIRPGQEIPPEGYLLCRSRIQPIKLVPPLTLMTLLRSDLQTISDWTVIPIGHSGQ
jgi:hypothetical protein